jgi:sarcosine oxidase
MPTLLGPQYRSLFKVTRQVMFWFAPEREDDLETFRADRLPVFVWLFSKTEGVYGFPALGTAQDGIKIATEYDLETTPDDVDWSVGEREKQDMYERFIRPRLRGISSRCARAEVCLYTVFAEDQGFLIDRHPAMDRVLVASPCSGHGFKHSPAIGELLAQMALGDAHQDIRMLGFAGRSHQ